MYSCLLRHWKCQNQFTEDVLIAFRRSSLFLINAKLKSVFNIKKKTDWLCSCRQQNGIHASKPMAGFEVLIIIAVGYFLCKIFIAGVHYISFHIDFTDFSWLSINQSIGVPSLRRSWRPWCAIRFCQVPSHCTVPYSFSSSRSRCQSNSFFFVLCLFFHPPCPPRLIFVGNDASQNGL